MIDTPVKPTIDRTSDIPPAFYRDADPPPPPPDDPHWREWSYNDGEERIPRWLVYGLPALLVFAAVFHCILLLIILESPAVT